MWNFVISCSSSNITGETKSRKRWPSRVARMPKRKGADKVLVEKAEGTRPLGRSRCWL